TNAGCSGVAASSYYNTDGRDVDIEATGAFFRPGKTAAASQYLPPAISWGHRD
ncbi:unnamed protein product, partial [Ectocarpus sp. 12 AP-2014]